MQLDVSLKKMIMHEEAVYKKMEGKRRTALKRAGGLIRSVSRRSMRRPNRQYKAAKFVGDWSKVRSRGTKPPLRWMDRRRGGGLYRMMLFTYDDRVKSVVVGPTGFGRPKAGGAVPGQVEAGGRRRIRNIRSKKRKIGDGGEVAVSSRFQFSKRGKQLKSTKVALNRFGNTRYVRYIKIRTSAQAARANKLNRELYGPETMTVNTKPHEYMGPVIRDTQIKAKIAGFFGDN